MRKLLIILLAIAMSLGLCACGKSEAAQAVDDLIVAIGTVTLENENSIIIAEKAVASLTEKEQKQLDNQQILSDARATYNELLIKEVENTIASIGVITLNSAPAIENAWDVYNSLPDELKDSVSNFNDLIFAEEAFIEGKAQVIENIIDELYPITTKSKNAIEDAWKAYDKADESVKKAVDNYDALVSAETEFITAKAKAIDDLILEISTVTLDSSNAIVTARKAYENADTDTQKAVQKLAVLTSAEEKLSSLKVQNVTELIGAIGTVTLDSEDNISAAQNAFNKLTTSEIAQISNAEVLSEAQKTFKVLKDEQREKELKTALAKLDSNYDKVQAITWYEAPAQPYYADIRSYVLPYIGQNSTNTWLRFRMHYTGDSWIFFEKITFLVDGEYTYKYFSYYDVERDNDSEVWEWADISPTEEDIELLWSIANSNETIVRFEGDIYHYDLTVKASDKQAIKDVLNAYNLMIEQ